MRKSRVPRGGWTFENYKGESAKRLMQDIMSARKLALRDNTSKLTRKVSKMIQDELDEVLTRFVTRLASKQKSIGGKIKRILLSIIVADGTERIFEAALREVFNEEESVGKVTKVFKPSYVDVMTTVEEKTSVVIQSPFVYPDDDDEEELDDDDFDEVIKPVRRITRDKMPKVIDRRADMMCEKVTRIRQTTRNRMKAFFKKHIEGKTSVGDMIKLMRKEFKSIAKSRIPTIVRNELAMAANEAQILAFQNSEVLTHCSVIGCQSVEDDAPTYKGFPTCNLQNVPVEDLHLVEFHINHTGTWIPTGFRKDDGSVPRLRLYNEAGTLDKPKGSRRN